MPSESGPAAERFLKAFQERLAKFGLELHPEKTRLIDLGRFAAPNWKQRGEGKPATFTFLGLMNFWQHIAQAREGFVVMAQGEGGTVT